MLRPVSTGSRIIRFIFDTVRLKCICRILVICFTGHLYLDYLIYILSFNNMFEGTDRVGVQTVLHLELNCYVLLHYYR